MKSTCTIEGVFRVSGYKKTDYGLQAVVTEVDEVYPVSFLLSLPDSARWTDGDTLQLRLVCTVVSVTSKSTGHRFNKYVVSDASAQRVAVVIEPVSSKK